MTLLQLFVSDIGTSLSGLDPKKMPSVLIVVLINYTMAWGF